jgi:hypothetical protein
MSKPNTLPISDFALAVADDLTRNKAIETDVMLLPLTRYQHMLDEMRTTYRSERSVSSQYRLASHAKRMLAALDTWYLELGDSLREAGALLPSYRDHLSDVP